MVSREVFQEDALEWLGKRAPLPSSSLVASLPDYSEFPKLSLAEWKIWFEEAACAIMRSCPERGVVIFYQRDIKHDGVWVDKAFLCQKAAEKEGMHQLWHKIVQRAPAGQVTFGKPGYSHLICFSRGLHLEPGQSSADVLVDAGESTWVRGMGTRVCEMICGFLLKDRKSTRLNSSH